MILLIHLMVTQMTALCFYHALTVIAPVRLNWHYDIIIKLYVGNEPCMSKNLCDSTGGELGSLWRDRDNNHAENADKKLC
jgi:hypothetical protein